MQSLPVCPPMRDCVRAAGRWPAVWLALAAVVAVGLPARGQYDLSDEPLLASTISETNVELRGRYVRQWTQADGTLVLMFNGGFRLDMGQRRMAATNAVVWIAPQRADPEGRKYYELTVYLSENAEVAEPGGTVTLDTVLLVRGIRTAGQIIKYDDAHLTEDFSASPLYQQALNDRLLIEAAEAQAPGVARPQGIRRPQAERPPRLIRYRLPKIEPARTAGGEAVFVSTGGVYFSQDGGPDAPMLEIRADNAVVFPGEGAAGAFVGEELEGRAVSPAEPARREEPEPPPAPLKPVPAPSAETQPATRPTPGPLGMEATLAGGQVRGVYLEGDVVLSAGTRFVRANRLYYDFEHDRAVILDAVFRADIPSRGIPLYVRAEEIRQLSAREFAAQHAVVTTSEFYTPSYHVGADRVVLRDVTVRDAEGRAAGPVRGNYELRNATLNVEGWPVAWWPYSRGTFEQSETLLRSFAAGYRKNFGAEVRTKWYLFNLLGVPAPEGYDATLRLDYFSARGPGVGINADYERESHYGLFRGYYLHDEGEDNLGPLRKMDEQPSTKERGRILWRHRHYLPDNWEITLEFAYHSDPYFLETFEKSEYNEGKEQETAVYLKRARGNEAVTLLANWRILDFLTQTEHLPDFAYRRIGDTFLDPLVSYSEARFGTVRYLPDDRRYYDTRRFNNDGRSDLTVRGDARQEFELPLKLGPVNVVPFASLRGSYWDGQPLDDGALWRGLGMYGVRGGTSFSRVFPELRSQLLDVDGIRHIVRPDFAFWWGHSNTRSELITPFDYGIETIDAFHGGTLGLRQTWQTKRGPEGQRRTVDLLTFNLEAGVFGDTEGRREKSNGYANPLRPENSRTRNYLAGDLVYRLSDSTSLLYDFNFDLNDQAFDRHNVSIAVERSPRLAYVFGLRYAGDIDLCMVGGGWNYKLSEKHITALRAWWDADTGRVGEVAFAYIRKLPRWYAGFTFEYDNVDDDFTITMSVWPEGIPEWTLGSRRFTGLGTTTGIRP
jgi:hypothetical protein